MLDILFVTPTSELNICHEVNGTMLLGTKLLQAGFSVEVLRFGEEDSYNKDYAAFVDAMAKRIVREAPKCVSFYTLWPTYHIMLRIAQKVKDANPEILIVFGGPLASLTARQTMESMPFIDCISTGEGENIVVPLFSLLTKRAALTVADVPGIYLRENGQIVCNEEKGELCDLNTLPNWDERLYRKLLPVTEETKKHYMPIDAGRGCPFNCTFCCSSHFWRRAYRLKSADRIIEDILHFKKEFGVNRFWFSHDAFTFNKKLVEQVCDRIIAEDLNIEWRCSTRIDCVTEELILKMKQAGMTQIEVGIETGSERMQRLTHKNLNLEKAKDMIRFMLKNKIGVSLFFMYGFPEETKDDLRQTLALMYSLVDMGVGHVTMAYTRFNPATQIALDHFDDLVADQSIKVLARGVFGFEEEWEMIVQNKVLFPFFYHLNTPVRNEFQYLNFLVYSYQKFPGAARYLRELYDYDDLKLYEDFYACNEESFAGDMNHAMQCVIHHSLEMFERVLDHLEDPQAKQVKGLLQYDHDLQLVKKSEEDIRLEKTYDFSILDLRRKRALRQYSQVATTILIEKKDGKTKTEILDIK